LKSVEPAPGNSHHPNRAIAPGLSCQPGDHLHAIILFLIGVLVEQQTRRFAATSKVDANAGIAVTCEIGMSQRIPLVRAVSFAIGEILQDRRDGVFLGILRQPNASRQRRAVFQRYQCVLDDPHSSWEGRDNHRTLHTIRSFGRSVDLLINRRYSREAASASLRGPLRSVLVPVGPADASVEPEALGRRRILRYGNRKTNARPARSS